MPLSCSRCARYVYLGTRAAQAWLVASGSERAFAPCWRVPEDRQMHRQKKLARPYRACPRTNSPFSNLALTVGAAAAAQHAHRHSTHSSSNGDRIVC